MELPHNQQTVEPRQASRLRNKLAIVGLTGALVTGAVVGLSGLASAQGPTDQTADAPAAGSVEAEPAAERDGSGRTVDVEIHGDDDGFWYEVDISPEDVALLERFEDCLTEAGLDDLEAELEEAEEAGTLDDHSVEAFEGIDRIFEACEPILDDLSEDAEWFLDEEFEGCEDDDHDETDVDETDDEETDDEEA